MSKEFPDCVQCDKLNDGEFDFCKDCTIEECRNWIGEQQRILDSFSKVVRAAKKWQAAKIMAMPLTFKIEKEAGIVDKENRTVEIVEAENGVIIALGNLEKAGIEIKL